MRKITVEVPDKRCAGCYYLTHVPPETALDDFVCNLFEEDIMDYSPCPQCIAAGQTKHLLIYMDGGIPQHVDIVSSSAEAEEAIRKYYQTPLYEDICVAEQMGDTWGRVDIDGEAEVYIVPFGQVE